ncbi:hypothetical protein CTheo_5048 [Ceratobasidium theobromae]|uniref:Protein PNS1 n=1 Tax=Ceratobasidium theobromae TaxID=1582974 RepID=A0A5N5QJ49_9AGAM|nr:hypothetical protein CTheo_5048 [Ceratobasidium theobromae]
MPASFSAYASQFLNRSTNNGTQPMFYSVVEGNESQFGLAESQSRHSTAELDDDGLPMLPGGRTIFDSGEHYGERSSILEADSRSSTPQLPQAVGSQHLDVENPYLDEQDLDMDNMMPPDSIPLIASPPRSPSPKRNRPPAAGWLAHLSHSGHPGPSKPKAAMSPMRNSSSDDSGDDTDSSADLPLFPASPSPPPRQQIVPPPPRTQRDPVILEPTRTHIELTESLLPRDGIERSIFSLPDPARTPYRKYNDPLWTALWCSSLLFSFVGSIVIIFFTNSHPVPTIPIPGRKLITPFSTMTHTIPLLTLVVFFSAVLGYLYLILLRYFAKPVLTATALAAPLALLFAAVWAFGGSFMWDEDGVGETWGETVGLRLFALIPLILAGITATAIYARYKVLLRGLSVISLSSSLALSYPPLLALSLALLVGALVLSIPFLALIFRLLLVGKFETIDDSYSWKVDGWAWWMAVLVGVVWMWSWAVVRGVMRASVAAVVGSCPLGTPPPPLPESTDTTRLAVLRATGPSLGSVCASALILTISRAVGYLLVSFRRLTTPSALSKIPLPLPPPVKLQLITFLITIGQSELIGAILRFLSRYGGNTDVQILMGVSGDGVWRCAKRVPELLSTKNTMKDKRTTREYQLLSGIQIAAALGFGVFAAIGGYIYAAHALSDPKYAPLAALLVGAGTYVTVRFGMGVVDDTADALFLCYCLDYEHGTTPRKDVRGAFEGSARTGMAAV